MDALDVRLRAAKGIVDAAPAIVASGLRATDAQRLKQNLEAAGAVAEVRGEAEGLHIVR